MQYIGLNVLIPHPLLPTMRGALGLFHHDMASDLGVIRAVQLEILGTDISLVSAVGVLSRDDSLQLLVLDLVDTSGVGGGRDGLRDEKSQAIGGLDDLEGAARLLA